MITKIFELLSKIKILARTNIKVKPILGRWSILTSKYNNRKVDMANIDHCGTCTYHTMKPYHKDTIEKDITEKEINANIPVRTNLIKNTL